MIFSWTYESFWRKIWASQHLKDRLADINVKISQIRAYLPGVAFSWRPSVWSTAAARGSSCPCTSPPPSSCNADGTESCKRKNALISPSSYPVISFVTFAWYGNNTSIIATRSFRGSCNGDMIPRSFPDTPHDSSSPYLVVSFASFAGLGWKLICIVACGS